MRRNKNYYWYTVASFLALLVTAVGAHALPFNDDMVDSQIKTGQAMRALPAGSIPLGSLNPMFGDRAEAEALTNPKKGDAESIRKGKPLFGLYCEACHGEPKKTDYKPSHIQLGAPNLADALYDEDASDGQTRTDGQIFRAIYFGNLIMPAVGWKISPDEAWDIINYVRSVQNGE